MSIIKIIAGVSGVFLIFLGLIGSVISVLAVINPVGTQAADDANPFGTPPSLLDSVSMLLLFLCVYTAQGC